MIRTTQLLASLALVAGLALSSGCSSINKQPPQQPIDPNAPSFLLEMRPTSGKPIRTQMVLTGNMFVQDVIDQSRAKSRLGRMKITVYRKKQKGGGFVKLKTENRLGKVAPTSNFAIHPGDRVVMIQDSATVLDDLMDAVKGPLGSSF